MTRAVIMVAALMALTGCQDAQPSFSAVAITLPQAEPAFPVRPGVEAVIANCAACHSPDMILNQPALTREQWRANITKMREVYQATIDPASEPAILDYLMATSAAVRQ